MARALRAYLAVLALLFAVAGWGLAAAGSAAAVDTSRGRPGFCPDANGVTVVVDFRELGGTTIVRCAVGRQATGLAALKAAGIHVTGTNRWGEAFICRLENKPGPESEPCIDTPPTRAYWSYWHAPNGGRWSYSQYGATYRTPPTGSFEGWSFSLDREADEAAEPRVAPRRPAPSTPPAPPSKPQPGGGGSGSGQGDGVDPGPAPGTDPGNGAGRGGDGGAEDAPRTGDERPDRRPASGDQDQTDDADADDPDAARDGGERQADEEGPAGRARPSGSPSAAGPAAPSDPKAPPSPTEAADWTGGEEQPVETAAHDSDIPTGTLLGAGAAAALAAFAGVTAWRRRAAGTQDRTR
ncbi:hypothetical protein LRS74_03720 [Streptomyces sp. LX-29]|uniref:hypothetical protein n=1 Tax=Streptomyces sp. LX-29 TaxID=2900152 RepID=UPI00240D2F17|nr:hypothetical protein [Streptomyces sp. LX-29]WFB06252.1 hypothetical protein LRS74_03720 [Streptomyces sp. LX-29]